MSRSRRQFLGGSAVSPLLLAQVPTQPVPFGRRWSSVYRPDPLYPHHLVNAQGEHLFLLNKTGWAYFGCKDPKGFADRSAAQGITTLRVALEGTPYADVLGIDLWPWGGTRDKPDFTTFNEAYWNQVEDRVRLGGRAGLGFDVVLHFTLRNQTDVERFRPYWQYALRRLGRYTNVLTWEIANEFIGNETFQDTAGRFFQENDPWRRPVCTSDGTTDDAVWPHKDWMGLAVVHTCTGSGPEWDLRDWYQAVARNTRFHGKPAFNNESGRERRHRNDDGVHRRKQSWTWCCSGGYWTWHSWDGCEGIDDPAYAAAGLEYVKPLSVFFHSIPFWTLDPNLTAVTADNANLVLSVLAHPDRRLSVAYLCTRRTGESVAEQKLEVRLPDGVYAVRFRSPVDLSDIARADVTSTGLRNTQLVGVPPFTDDILMQIERTGERPRTRVKGTA
jgi:hypothetical protein